MNREIDCYYYNILYHKNSYFVNHQISNTSLHALPKVRSQILLSYLPSEYMVYVYRHCVRCKPLIQFIGANGVFRVSYRPLSSSYQFLFDAWMIFPLLLLLLLLLFTLLRKFQQNQKPISRMVNRRLTDKTPALSFPCFCRALDGAGIVLLVGKSRFFPPPSLRCWL